MANPNFGPNISCIFHNFINGCHSLFNIVSLDLYFCHDSNAHANGGTGKNLPSIQFFLCMITQFKFTCMFRTHLHNLNLFTSFELMYMAGFHLGGAGGAFAPLARISPGPPLKLGCPTLPHPVHRLPKFLTFNFCPL